MQERGTSHYQQLAIEQLLQPRDCTRTRRDRGLLQLGISPYLAFGVDSIHECWSSLHAF